MRLLKFILATIFLLSLFALNVPNRAKAYQFQDIFEQKKQTNQLDYSNMAMSPDSFNIVPAGYAVPVTNYILKERNNFTSCGRWETQAGLFQGPTQISDWNSLMDTCINASDRWFYQSHFYWRNTSTKEIWLYYRLTTSTGSDHTWWKRRFFPLVWDTPPGPFLWTSIDKSCQGTQSQVALSWTSSTGATSYDIYRSSASTGPWTKLSSTPSAIRTYTDQIEESDQNRLFYYKIDAVKTSGLTTSITNSVRTAVCVAPPPPPPPPIGDRNVKVIVEWPEFGETRSIEMTTVLKDIR